MTKYFELIQIQFEEHKKQNMIDQLAERDYINTDDEYLDHWNQ